MLPAMRRQRVTISSHNTMYYYADETTAPIRVRDWIDVLDRINVDISLCVWMDYIPHTAKYSHLPAPIDPRALFV